MLILNEAAYVAAVLDGDFTNQGVLIPARNNRCYIPLVRAAWNVDGNRRRAFARAIDRCGISNFTGDGFQQLFQQWKTSWRGKHPAWQGELPALAGQKVTIDTPELECLFSLPSARVRAKNFMALFLIRYLGIRYPKVKFPYSLLCELCGYKIGDHWNKQLCGDMGLSSNRSEWAYDRAAMLRFHAGRSGNPTLPESLKFEPRFEGDYIYHPGLPFDHNGTGLIQAFESLRNRRAYEK